MLSEKIIIEHNIKQYKITTRQYSQVCLSQHKSTNIVGIYFLVNLSIRRRLILCKKIRLCYVPSFMKIWMHRENALIHCGDVLMNTHKNKNNK